MNREALLQVADVIEYFGRFDMNYPTHRRSVGYTFHQPDPTELWEDCGTVGCVWGWTNAWAGNDEVSESAARRELGLTQDQAQNLFYAEGGSVWVRLADEFGWELDLAWDDFDEENLSLANWTDITAPQAAEVLRRIANGTVTL